MKLIRRLLFSLFLEWVCKWYEPDSIAFGIASRETPHIVCLLPRLLKRDRIVASFGWFKATSRLGRAPIMDTDYAVDCLPGSMERQPRSTLHQDENHALSILTNNICLFLSRPAKQRIPPQIPFASTCWKEQVRTRLVLDSICKTGVCSHLVRWGERCSRKRQRLLLLAGFRFPWERAWKEDLLLS